MLNQPRTNTAHRFMRPPVAYVTMPAIGQAWCLTSKARLSPKVQHTGGNGLLTEKKVALCLHLLPQKKVLFRVRRFPLLFTFWPNLNPKQKKEKVLFGVSGLRVLASKSKRASVTVYLCTSCCKTQKYQGSTIVLTDITGLLLS